MAGDDEFRPAIKRLLSDYSRLSNPDNEPEKRTEEFIRPLLEHIGWMWLSNEVKPQNVTKSGFRTTRVDYCFKRNGEMKPSFYLEAKRFSNNLENHKDINQAIEYGKNGGARWVVLTNFIKWRVFNSDYFDEQENAELFEFDIQDCLEDSEKMQWLLMFSREHGGPVLDEYAKKHKKWKESESVEELLTEQLMETREKLSKVIREQNSNLFDTTPDSEDISLDACVQHLLNRIIFSRMAEDNGAEADYKMGNIIEKWKSDKRVQLYRDCICPFWGTKMRKRYDSTIFDNHRVEGLSIKNEDFVPIIESFYVNPNTGLRYRFEAIPTDVLGHAYENYISYKVKQTAKRTGLEKELYKRKQGGIYYTPQFLVDYLVMATLGERLKECKTPEEALKIRVLDPACGSGTFLVRALEEFKSWFSGNAESKENDGGISDFTNAVLENCIYGIDLDPSAVRLAKLNLFLHAMGTQKHLPGLNILERNSIAIDGDLPKSLNTGRDFPLVHEQGGFDIVLGNPPWEKWKPDSQEFFEQFEPGFKSLPAQQAKKRMEDILKTRKYARMQWEAKLREYEIYSEIYRENYKFQSADVNGRGVSGDIDLYKVFTERFHQLLKDGGLAGIVVPSGIYTDLGAKGLRSMLFEHSQVKALYSFENRGHAIFPDVHASYKPVLLVFQKGGRTKSFPCAFFLHSNDDLQEAIENPTIMDIDFVKKSSPTSWGVLEIKSAKDYEIVQKLLKFPPLGQKIDGAWNIELSRGFDMTNDSHLFKTGVLAGVPMLEGKNIEQFTHKWKEAPTPRYKVFEKDIEANIKPEKIYHRGYWMAYRLIASSTNYRTFISTIVPPGYVCGNSLAIVRLPDLKELCFLAGVMNSFVVDYFMRQKISANINMFYFLETPVPRLSTGKEFDAIARKVAQLVCTTKEFDELKKLVGVEPVINENDRAMARAQLDVMVAKLYGITKDEFAYILEKFPLVDQKQKNLALSQY